jgi:hypothetical protein
MLEKVKEQTGETPISLAARPNLLPHLQHPWELFWELNQSRIYGAAGEQPLLLTEFLAHARLYQFTRLEAQENWEFVRVLDRAYRSFCAKRREAEAASGKSKGQGPKHKP